MPKPFNRVAGLNPGRSVFDLSYEKKFTCDMGQLIPIVCDEVVPGDVLSFGNQIVVRFQPLVAPMLHEVNVYVHYFFVPYRLLMDDWEDFLPKLAEQNLAGKKVALFGCGDADSYPDSFCEAIAKLKEGLASTGCTFIGAYAPEGYSYDATETEQGGKLVGLCIDEANQSDLTDERIEKWVALLQSEF